jgi:ABC-type polysaccharide/polyol phosphate export permease
MVSLIQFQQFWLQTSALAFANIRSRYRNTFAGFIWVILNPLVVFGIQNYVFKNIIGLKINDYALFLMTGLLPWLFISQTLDSMTPLFLSLGSLLKSMPIHPLVILTANLADYALNFLLSFSIILFGTLIVGHHESVKGLFFLPLALSLLIIGAFFLSWILAVLNVFYRDTRFLIGIGLNVLYYLTPICYSEEQIPRSVRWIIYLNPLYHLIRPVRLSIYEYDRALFFRSVLVALGTLLVLFFLASRFWRKVRNEFYFKI